MKPKGKRLIILDLIKIKNVYSSKIIIRQVKAQATGRKKLDAVVEPAEVLSLRM